MRALRLIAFRLVVAAIVGAGVLAGGCAPPTAVLGHEPAMRGAMTTVHDASPKTVVSMSGVMIEKCPTAGCWFKLRDETGVIRVDTKNAGFAVTEVPLQSRVTVTGKVVQRGAEKSIDANSLRY